MATRTGIGFLGGAGLGAGIVYFLDQGNSTDRVLAARVRAALGRAASHPGAIEIAVDGCCVTLTGPVLASEADEILARASRTAGVEEIVDRLERHASADGLPAMAELATRRPRAGMERDVWPRSLRMVAGGAGLGVGLAGLSHGGLTGKLMAAAGGVLFARAALNRGLGFGLGVRHARMTDLRKALVVQAPIGRVFEFWTDVANYPRFMEHVVEVRPSEREPDRTHWVVRGPAGIPVSWDAEVTRCVPNSIFAWKTMPGSAIEHAGTILFEEVGKDTTRVHVHMLYHPPAGAFGHAVATLLGGDPKSRMDDDLARFKALIEDTVNEQREAGLEPLEPVVEAVLRERLL
jgi:uncharacterized membrane protein